MRKIMVLPAAAALALLTACGGGTSPAQACENALKASFPTARSLVKADPSGVTSGNSFSGEPGSVSAACNSLDTADQATVTAWVKRYYLSHVG